MCSCESTDPELEEQKRQSLAEDTTFRGKNLNKVQIKASLNSIIENILWKAVNCFELIDNLFLDLDKSWKSIVAEVLERLESLDTPVLKVHVSCIITFFFIFR